MIPGRPLRRVDRDERREVGHQAVLESDLQDLVGAIVAGVTGYVGGHLSDRVGRRRLMLIGEASLCALAPLFLFVGDNVLLGLHLASRQTPLAIMLGLPSVAQEERALAQEARRILGFVDLDARAAQLASALPYGELRLLEVAIALAAKPKLLLLDEPVSGMNPAETESFMKMLARIRALLRRRPPRGSAFLVVGDLRLNPDSREVYRGERNLELTAREFELLAHVARHPRRAFSREELLERVWGYTFGDTATVTVHVRRLREKIEPEPSEPRHLVTVWGVGYRFAP